MWQDRIELACSLLNYSAHPFQRGLEGIARAGYKYVMLGGEHPVSTGATEKHRPLHGRMTDDALKTLKKQVADAGLQVKSGIIGLEIHLEEPGGAELYRREIDLWAALGVKRLVGLGPWYYKKWPTEIQPPEAWRETCERYYKLLDEFRPAVEKAGLTICIKPHTGICAHSGLVLPTMKRLNAPCYQVCWDAGNVSFYEGISPDPGLEKVAQYVKAVCLKDHKGPRAHPVFPPLGEGNVDHDEYFRILARAGFNGVMMIERLGVREGETLTADQIDARGKDMQAFLTPLFEKHFGGK
ncbi:MAG TPA: sugar phosphate isomerase/epimerase family protein [Planctomycetota bacterium]|nr:sugar phosphate isomerase/epimerase family protein [Planctomycetota bacterium]